MTRLPDFVVLGQGKAGTSLIYRVLKRNPDIGLSRPKELHYFSQNLDKGLEHYARHFAHLNGDEALVGEVSPSYLRRAAVDAVAETLGRDTKVIFILRRPVEQAYSRYLQNICASETGVSFGQTTKRFDANVNAVFDAIQTAYERFGADNVLPLFFERDIAGDAAGFESRILAFLGLPATEYGQKILSRGRVNAGIMPRYIFGGDAPLHLHHAEAEYTVPANQLVFCAQKRNSKIYEDPTPEQVRDAFVRQSHWSGAVSEQDYAQFFDDTVGPAAERFEAAFGFDMDHWRIAPRRIIYPPAPPPAQFKTAS